MDSDESKTPLGSHVGPLGPASIVSRNRRCSRIGLIVVSLVLLLLIGCSTKPYNPSSLDVSTLEENAVALSASNFDVRASVPGADQAQALLGIDVYSRDIQPVWVEISNRDDTRARVAISSIDPKYFPPAEVAWFFKKKFSREGWMDLERRLIELSLPRYIEPGETVSGFVFTNLEPGTKAFNLDVFRGSLPPEHEQFTFFLRVPGFVPDYADVRFRDLYPEDQLVATTIDDLPVALGNLACCTSNADGTLLGRPVNIFIVSDPLVLLRSLLRAGWAESAVGAAAADEASVHMLFDRPADGVFRKPRDGNTDRSELAIWKTPILLDGEPVWAAQVRHAVGRRFSLGERLFGVRLDPDVDEGRNYLLQTFWYAQTLHQWGLSPSGEAVPQTDPKLDFLGNPWFSLDGRDMVIWLSDDPVPMNEAQYVEWNDHRNVDGEGP